VNHVALLVNSQQGNRTYLWGGNFGIFGAEWLWQNWHDPPDLSYSRGNTIISHAKMHVHFH